MIKVRDIAYVRFGAPNLDEMQRFLIDFGLTIAAHTDERIFARGSDASPYIHVSERGDPGFRGLAFEAESIEDLNAAARLEGASVIEKIDAPGGGQRVCFVDPGGIAVEVVYGQERQAPLAIPPAAAVNRGSDRVRLGETRRLVSGPPPIKRLGHVVLRVSDYRSSAEWYKSRFGLLSSDEVYLGERENIVAAFMRCDRGEEYVDHHALVCAGVGDPGFDHAAFEVEDVDAVMLGHHQLSKAGYKHRNGVGRHVLGSQVYDYWNDPWGQMLEHFTDGDLFNNTHPTELHAPDLVLGNQWGGPISV